jgi:hypothetical protein
MNSKRHFVAGYREQRKHDTAENEKMSKGTGKMLEKNIERSKYMSSAPIRRHKLYSNMRY